MRMLVIARNGAVGIEGRHIVAPEGRFDVELRIPDGEVRPGLVNAHDHLHRNHYGRLGRPPYRNAYHWAADIQARYRRHIARRRQKPRHEALLAGAWKNLFAGVTTVVHHDPWEAAFDQGFPIRVARVASIDSIGMAPDLPASARRPFAIHLAEGIDGVAAGEVAALADRGLLDAGLIAVHGVGMDRDSVARFRQSGAALVWCPTSNLFLFGRTAPVALLNSGCELMLGSDSRLTGAGDLLDELRAARALGPVDDARLEAAVGTVAARRLGLAPPSLEPGAVADLIVLRAPLLQARAAQVALVVVDGSPRVACPALAPELIPVAGRGRKLTLGGVARWTSAPACSEAGRNRT